VKLSEVQVGRLLKKMGATHQPLRQPCAATSPA
jgi:hypothetical protein